MKAVKTFWARIFIGCRVGYSDTLYDLATIQHTCQGFCSKIGLCVTVTPTEYVYTGGNEPGAIVELIHYPRFPSTAADIREKAFALARALKTTLEQNRVTVMMPDETIMLGEE